MAEPTVVALLSPPHGGLLDMNSVWKLVGVRKLCVGGIE